MQKHILNKISKKIIFRRLRIKREELSKVRLNPLYLFSLINGMNPKSQNHSVHHATK